MSESLIDTSIRHAPDAMRPGWTLLLECARSFGIGTTPDRSAATAIRDWKSFTASAFNHGLLHIATDRLQLLGSALAIQELRRVAFLRGMLSQAVQQEWFLILETLRQQEIDAITFKGPALSKRAYGSVGLRQSGDIDLLITRDDFMDAYEILVGRGYDPRIPRDLTPKALTHKKNGVTFESDLVNVDLHWTLDDYPFEFDRDMGDVWRDSQSIRIADNEIRGLSPLDEFLFVCFHGSKHCWVRLIWICDVALSARLLAESDWAAVMAYCRRTRRTRMIAVALLLASGFCRIEIPESFRRLIKDDRSVHSLAIEVAGWLARGPSPAEIRRYRVQVAERWSEKGQVVAHIVRRRLLKPEF